MNIQTNIPNTGGNNLQNASFEADHSLREAPKPVDQLIKQEEANPAIQQMLDKILSVIVELDAKIDEQQQEFLLSIAQDPKESLPNRLEAVKLIPDDTQRHVVYLSIAQDPEVEATYRLEAVELIQGSAERDTVDALCLSIVQNFKAKEAIGSIIKAAELIQNDAQSAAACLSIVQNPEVDAECLPFVVEWIEDRMKYNIQRDTVYLAIAQNPKMDADYRLWATSLIIDPTIQAECYPGVIANILSIQGFSCMDELIRFVELDLPDAGAEIKDQVIKTICQNWPLVEEKQVQKHFALLHSLYDDDWFESDDVARADLIREHLAAFRELYAFVSDDVVRVDLITAIVTRTDLDAGFRKTIVEAHEKDPAERERLIKIIEEKQEGSLIGSYTKKAR